MLLCVCLRVSVGVDGCGWLDGCAHLWLGEVVYIHAALTWRARVTCLKIAAAQRTTADDQPHVIQNTVGGDGLARHRGDEACEVMTSRFEIRIETSAPVTFAMEDMPLSVTTG